MSQRKKKKPRPAKEAPKQLPPHAYEAEVVDGIPEPEPEPGAAKPVENIGKLIGLLLTGAAIGYLTEQPAKPTPVPFTLADVLMGKKKP